MKIKEELNNRSGVIIDAAMEVHRELGPRLLERIYKAALQRKLAYRGIHAQRQVQTVVFDKREFLDENAYRIDLLVDESVVVGIKTVTAIIPIHEAQLNTYMRLSKKCLVLLINFNVIHPS
jgi:GxxExxY protein